jgi:hypothetical protein
MRQLHDEISSKVVLDFSIVLKSTDHVLQCSCVNYCYPFNQPTNLTYDTTHKRIYTAVHYLYEHEYTKQAVNLRYFDWLGLFYCQRKTLENCVKIFNLLSIRYTRGRMLFPGGK